MKPEIVVSKSESSFLEFIQPASGSSRAPPPSQPTPPSWGVQPHPASRDPVETAFLPLSPRLGGTLESSHFLHHSLFLLPCCRHHLSTQHACGSAWCWLLFVWHPSLAVSWATLSPSTLNLWIQCTCSGPSLLTSCSAELDPLDKAQDFASKS